MTLIGDRPNKKNIELLNLTRKVNILRLWRGKFFSHQVHGCRKHGSFSIATHQFEKKKNLLKLLRYYVYYCLIRLMLKSLSLQVLKDFQSFVFKIYGIRYVCNIENITSNQGYKDN